MFVWKMDLGASSGQRESEPRKGRDNIGYDEQVSIVGAVTQPVPAVGGNMEHTA